LKPSEKEKYQLWWEYLKLSENYKEYCKNPQVHREAMLKLKAAHPNLTEEEEKEGIQELLYGAHGIPDVYETFGDAFNGSFEDFWRKKGKYLKKSLRLPRVIIKNVEDVINGISSFYEFRRPIKDQSYSNFKKIIKESLSNSSNHLFLKIDLTFPVGEIVKEFKNILTTQKRNKEAISLKRALKWSDCCNRKPTPNLFYDEVKRYLEILKVYKVDRLKGKKAFKKVYPEGNYSDQAKVSEFHSDRRKAKRIVKNTEIGLFPGRYQK